MKRSHTLGLFLSLSIGLHSVGFSAIVTTVDFSGEYDVANWSFDQGGGDGYIDLTNAPDSFRLYGSDSNSGVGNHIETSFSITIPGTGNGELSFTWRQLTLDAVIVRDMGYMSINGVETVLPDPYDTTTQFDSLSGISVNGGDELSFYIRAIEDSGGRGILVISEFAVVPEPKSFASILALLTLLATVGLRSIPAQIQLSPK